MFLHVADQHSDDTVRTAEGDSVMADEVIGQFSNRAVVFEQLLEASVLS